MKVEYQSKNHPDRIFKLLEIKEGVAMLEIVVSDCKYEVGNTINVCEEYFLEKYDVL